MFDLNQSITQWQHKLAAAGSVSQAELEELTSHLIEQVEQLQETGLSEEEGFMIASHRIGDVRSLAEEFLNAAPARRWAQRVIWGVIGVTILLGAASLFATVIWLAEGGWTQVATNLSAFGRGAMTWPNALLFLAASAVVLATYRLLVCRLFPGQRLVFILMLSAMLAGQWVYELTMIGAAPLDSSFSPQPFDRAGPAITFTLMTAIAVPLGFCLAFWLKKRRIHNV